MKINTSDINTFKSIDEVYEFLELNAYNVKRNWNTEIGTLWLKYKAHTKNEVEKNKAQFEIDYWHFIFHGDRLFSSIYSIMEDNFKLNAYPQIEESKDESIKYLKSRAENSKHPILVAKYNHLLWKSERPIPRQEYAIAAIKNYIEATKQYQKQYIKDNNPEDLFRLSTLFELATSVSDEIKSDLKELLDLTQSLLFKTNMEFNAFVNIVNAMLKHNRLFKVKKFDNVLSVFEKEIPNLHADLNYVSYHIPTALRLANKTNADVKIWHNEMGMAYLRMAAGETKEDRLWLKQDYHYKAIEAFTLAANEVKKQEAERLYAELKPHIKLPLCSIELTTEHFALIKNTES